MNIHQHTQQPDVEVKYTGQQPERKPVQKKKQIFYMALGGVFFILLLAGIGTGYLLASPGKGTATNGQAISTDGGKTFGSADVKEFTDTAVGTVEKDGISGEGTHKLIREGGSSQTACLVSSVLDLDEFIGKKVKVNSKTMAAKKCPWLMDVGRIELQ